MKTDRVRFWLLICAVGISPASLQVRGEIPKLSEKELNELASHAVTGQVVRTYEWKSHEKDFERTYGVAEIAVGGVKKGSDIQVGDRIFVRYWRQRWVRGGNPPPGHYGHWNIPAETDAVVCFVAGDRKSGLDVLSPNGFFLVKKAQAKK